MQVADILIKSKLKTKLTDYNQNVFIGVTRLAFVPILLLKPIIINVYYNHIAMTSDPTTKTNNKCLLYSHYYDQVMIPYNRITRN